MALSLAVKMGSGATLEGNATVGDVLKGVTFYNDDPSEIKTGILELTGDASAGDVKSGKTFYNTDAKTIQTGTFASQEKTVTSSVSDQTVTPDSGKYLSKVTVNKLTMSGTYTTTTRGTAVDMGESNTYRYVNTNGVTNTNSGTYSASSRSASLDMGATNTYRYVNTNGVPDSTSYGTNAGQLNSTAVGSITLSRAVSKGLLVIGFSPYDNGTAATINSFSVSKSRSSATISEIKTLNLKGTIDQSDGKASVYNRLAVYRLSGFSSGDKITISSSFTFKCVINAFVLC